MTIGSTAKRPAGGGRAAALAALLLVSFCWGATFPVVKRATEAIPPSSFVVLRFAVALGILYAAARVRRRSLRPVLHWTAAAPGLLLAGGFLLQTLGLRTTSPSVSAFLTGLSVVIVPALGRALGWSRVSVVFWVQALLALAGLILLQGGRPPTEWHHGETLTIACAVAFAGQILLVERLGARQPDPLVFTAGQILWGSVALVVWMIASGERAFPTSPPPVLACLAAFFTGAIATAVAFLVQTWAQRRLRSTSVAVCYSTEPVFAALLSVAFFGDRIGGQAVAGVVLIFVALLLTAASVVPPGGSVEWGRNRC